MIRKCPSSTSVRRQEFFSSLSFLVFMFLHALGLLTDASLCEKTLICPAFPESLSLCINNHFGMSFESFCFVRSYPSSNTQRCKMLFLVFYLLGLPSAVVWFTAHHLHLHFRENELNTWNSALRVPFHVAFHLLTILHVRSSVICLMLEPVTCASCMPHCQKFFQSSTCGFLSNSSCVFLCQRFQVLARFPIAWFFHSILERWDRWFLIPMRWQQIKSSGSSCCCSCDTWAHANSF